MNAITASGELYGTLNGYVMNLQTFKAPTMAEALAQVKSIMGSEAVILHTRTLHHRQWLGLRRREFVEITAGRGLQVMNRSRRSVSNAAPPKPLGYARTAALMPPPANPTRTAIEGSRQLMESPAVGNAAILGLSQEMNSLKTMVRDLVNESRLRSCPQVPEDLFNYYQQLIENEVAEELATEIVKTVKQNVRAEHLTQPSFVQEKLAEQIEKLLPISGPIVRTRTTGPHVVALIGPTGVGKTTTIAKLAANLKLREKHRVGLITLDTYRIAAVDQLRKYAEIIGSPLRVVANSDDLREAMNSMSDCEFILIDTAGRSPNDTMKLNELKGLLNVANPDEVHLVLSTTSSQACVETAIERFNDVRVDKIIFTKLDEAAHVGVMFNVVRKVNKGLSYITTGQDVPDDIEVGRGRRLAQLILGNKL